MEFFFQNISRKNHSSFLDKFQFTLFKMNLVLKQKSSTGFPNKTFPSNSTICKQTFPTILFCFSSAQQRSVGGDREHVHRQALRLHHLRAEVAGVCQRTAGSSHSSKYYNSLRYFHVNIIIV